MKSWRALLLSLFVLFVAASADAQANAPVKINPIKEAAIRRLLDRSGARDLMDQTVQLMMTQMRSALAGAFPNSARGQEIMQAFFKKLETKFRAEELLELIVPVYDKHFSTEEVQQLEAFYATPIGQKLVKALPNIMRESQLAGAEWGQKKAAEAFNELAEQYPELKQAPKPPQDHP